LARRIRAKPPAEGAVGAGPAQRHACDAGEDPPEVVEKLNALLVAGVKSPAAKGFYDNSGTEAVTSTPDALAKFQQAETQKWGKVIKAAGIEAE
jgi:tripartite-type tricarboxylate transporter receptor subunit TctC